MQNKDMKTTMMSMTQERFGRRGFLQNAGLLGVGVAAAGLTLGTPAVAESEQDAATAAVTTTGASPQSRDTVAEIFTAALIAEDLATTFYYNVLVGNVIQDPNLAGKGGTATHVSASGNEGNVQYVRAALYEEIAHANLFRSLLGIGGASKDPVQMFYFPAGVFDTLGAFTGLLDALENAFIGAYLNAIQEFAFKAANRRLFPFFNAADLKYSTLDLEYFAKVSASIMGVEAEHRVLGRVISNTNPANNLVYQQTDGITAVYNGLNSAVVALTPFLTPSTGNAYSLATALANQGAVSLAVGGALPTP